MYKSILLLIIFCQAATAATADQRLVSQNLEGLGLNAELRVIGDISRKESGKLKLEFFDTKSKKRVPVKLDKVPEVSLWMEMENGKGHGSEKLKIEEKNSSYIISNAWFLMMGDWELKMKASHNDKTSLNSFPICVGRKPSDSHLGKCK